MALVLTVAGLNHLNQFRVISRVGKKADATLNIEVIRESPLSDIDRI